MWANIKYTWTHLRIIKKDKYGEVEEKEMIKLQSIFKSALEKPIENSYFDYDFKEKKPRHESTDLYDSLLVNFIPERINFNSQLAVYANSMLLEVANYLQRRNAKFANGYPNDPTNLFCLDLIHWLKEQLLKKDANEETRKEVNKRIKFLTSIRDNDVFSQSENSDHYSTLSITLVNLIKSLEKVEGYINFEINRFSVRQHLDTMVNVGKNTIAFLFEYLFYAIRDTDKLPLNCSILNLHDSIIAPKLKQEVEETLSGRFLIQIAYSEPIRELFIPLDGTEYVEIAYNQNEDLVTFLDKSSSSCTAVAQTVSSLMSSAAGNQPRTGICVSFAQDPTILKAFVEIHGLMELFAKIIILCRESSHIASKGGELLIGTFLREQFDFLIKSYIQTRSEILSRLSQLETILQKEHLKQFTLPNKDPWFNNYKAALCIQTSIKSALNDSKEASSQILGIMNNIDSRAIKLKKQVETFMREVNELSLNTPWLLADLNKKALDYTALGFPQNNNNNSSSPRMQDSAPETSSFSVIAPRPSTSSREVEALLQRVSNLNNAHKDRFGAHKSSEPKIVNFQTKVNK